MSRILAGGGGALQSQSERGEWRRAAGARHRTVGVSWMKMRERRGVELALEQGVEEWAFRGCERIRVSIAMVAEAAKEHVESYEMSVGKGRKMESSCFSDVLRTRCCCSSRSCCTWLLSAEILC